MNGKKDSFCIFTNPFPLPKKGFIFLSPNFISKAAVIGIFPLAIRIRSSVIRYLPKFFLISPLTWSVFIFEVVIFKEGHSSVFLRRMRQ